MTIDWTGLLLKSLSNTLEMLKQNPMLLLFLVAALIVSSLSKIKLSSNAIGAYGEKSTEKELRLVNLFGRKGKTLRNIYLPKDNGGTSEIDLVYITQKGIFVFESKNYSGWVFGDEANQYWTVTLSNGNKNKLYNPIKQNRTHMKWLGKYLGVDVPLFSIVVFSERCELKKVMVDSSDVKVIKRDRTYSTVRDIWEKNPDVLSEWEIDSIYHRLEKLTLR